MTTRILILVYIACVLFISGFAKADNSIGALVNTAEVNEATGILTVHGTLSTPCQIRPNIVINDIDTSRAIITMDVMTSTNSAICIEVLGAKYDVAYDLKELPLINGQTYQIIFKKSPSERAPLFFTAHPADQTLRPFKVDQKNFKGILVRRSNIDNETNGQFGLSDNQQVLPVVSPQMNLSKFEGRSVWISGYVVHVASLNNNDVNDPFGDSSSASVIVVPVSISAVRP
jgi:hypothetical protein